MKITSGSISSVKLIQFTRHGDDRGFLSETFRSSALKDNGLPANFVQENHSYSAQRGTIRGLHFQVAPHVQGKLVRVISGAILDVAVDLRTGSPTFGQHVAERISVEEWNGIYVPEGFAHGFCTLEPDTEVIYKLTDYYAPECERGVAWNDPDLAIDWPVSASEAILSDRDNVFPKLRDLKPVFSYKE